MDLEELRKILSAVGSGAMRPDEAERRLRWPGTSADVGGFATLDTHRRLRCGFPEVVFGQGKSADQVLSIVAAHRDRTGDGILVTRLDDNTAERLQLTYPRGKYHSAARAFYLDGDSPPAPGMGRVVVVTAGTSDMPVAEEARITAEAWGCEVGFVADVGVAGVHRLLERVDRLAGADVLVVVAGMEGALPSVVGGLVDCPVIAVPTSVGYGANFGGLSALLGMLNSCSSNVTVVNIDAGFNGGYVAGLIARRAGLARAGQASPESQTSKGLPKSRGTTKHEGSDKSNAVSKPVESSKSSILAPWEEEE
jgi:NCAIR mutase (PurE)-related protein